MKIDDYRIQTNPITSILTSLEPLLMIHKSVNTRANYNNDTGKLFVSINKSGVNNISEYRCSDVFQAIDKLNKVMASFASTFQPDELDTCNNNQVKNGRGGKRSGAGRPKTNPTKVVRLNEDEFRLVSEFRSMAGCKTKYLNRLIKYMAVLELDDIENQSKK